MTTVTGLPVRYRVAERRVETDDTVTLDLVPVEEAIEPFAPGQFTMLTAFGIGEVPISVSGDAARADRLVHTLRAVGPVTNALHGLREGAIVGVRGPFGIGWRVDEAVGRDVLFVAGGIGLAPLRPAVLEVLRNRSAYGRVVVLAGARSPADLLFLDDLREWAESVEVGVSVDRANAGWNGHVGLVTALFSRVRFDPARTTAYVCGPEIMIRVVSSELARRGVPTTCIRLSLERNMRCGVGLCGHCQLGPLLLCRDGPVVDLPVAEPLLTAREL